MNTENADYPPAETIEKEADEMPPKVNLRDYEKAMSSLKAKGYTYQDIADWLAEKLGCEVKRAQVYHILTAPSEVLDAEEEDEAHDDE